MTDQELIADVVREMLNAFGIIVWDATLPPEGETWN